MIARYTIKLHYGNIRPGTSLKDASPIAEIQTVEADTFMTAVYMGRKWAEKRVDEGIYQVTISGPDSVFFDDFGKWMPANKSEYQFAVYQLGSIGWKCIDASDKNMIDA